MMTGTDSDALAHLLEQRSRLGDLLRRPAGEQQTAGYHHTLREICQQPRTWMVTRAAAERWLPDLRGLLEKCRCLTLAGSGSSQYAGDCLAPVLQKELGVPAQAVSSGWVMMHLDTMAGLLVPSLMVSLARSGDSPESTGAVQSMLEAHPQTRHLVLTCNAGGRVVTMFGNDARVTVLALDDATNDRSLVMTSSFTNMVIAGRILGMLRRPGEYCRLVPALAAAACHLLIRHGDTIAEVAGSRFERAIFLGSGSRYGSAREAALKMLEMTSGRVFTMPETYLGVRHGPMSAIHPDTLVVCFLSSDALTRAYESDLIRELARKRLGARKLILGEEIPRDLVSPGDVALECPGMAAAGDRNVAVLDVVAGQLLAFFRCLADGLKPDMPSAGNIITRVVNDFALYRPEGGR